MNHSIGCLSLIWTNFALDLLDINGIFTPRPALEFKDMPRLSWWMYCKQKRLIYSGSCLIENPQGTSNRLWKEGREIQEAAGWGDFVLFSLVLTLFYPLRNLLFSDFLSQNHLLCVVPCMGTLVMVTICFQTQWTFKGIRTIVSSLWK